jgi:hypothetical protein
MFGNYGITGNEGRLVGRLYVTVLLFNTDTTPPFRTLPVWLADWLIGWCCHTWAPSPGKFVMRVGRDWCRRGLRVHVYGCLLVRTAKQGRVGPCAACSLAWVGCLLLERVVGGPNARADEARL